MKLLRVVILIISFFAFGGSLYCQDTTDSVIALAKLDTNAIAIGAQTELTLELTTSQLPRSYRWPVQGDTLNGGLEVLTRSGIDTITADGTVTLRESYLITSFDTGYVVIPPHVFAVNGSDVESNPLLLHITVPQLGGQEGMKDIFEVEDVDYGWLDVLKERWWVLTLFTILIVSAVLLIRRSRRSSAAVAVQVIEEKRLEADIEALQALAQLKEEAVWQKGRFKEYHTRLYDILRTYLERRYSIRVHERTTRQIISDLRTKGLDQELLSVLRATLELADMAKFAKYRPIAEENEASMQNAEELVKKTRKEEVTA